MYWRRIIFYVQIWNKVLASIRLWLMRSMTHDYRPTAYTCIFAFPTQLCTHGRLNELRNPVTSNNCWYPINSRETHSNHFYFRRLRNNAFFNRYNPITTGTTTAYFLRCRKWIITIYSPFKILIFFSSPCGPYHGNEFNTLKYICWMQTGFNVDNPWLKR